jgi:DNA-binding transcriptional regulator YhcF (GntR family)
MAISKWAFHTNLQWATVDKAIKILMKDGVIKMNPHAEGSYAVVPSALQVLESKFRHAGAKQLEKKILNAVRMMISRKLEKVTCERKLFEDSIRQASPERHAKQNTLGRFDWDTLPA